jgi:nicotinate-nucleotide adenylyltransferase
MSSAAPASAARAEPLPGRAPVLRRPVLRLSLPAPPEPPAPPRLLRVGLLGGSFNPAHDGHVHISVEALKRLALDQVWWLVSPQNPLKPVAGMAPLAERMAQARGLVRHPRIRVLDLERRLGTRYTADTLHRLAAWPRLRPVWLIGADNLLQLPRWRRWRELLRTAPVAVLERAPYSYAALGGKASRGFAGARLANDRLDLLAEMPPPAWAFIRLRPHPASSTAIRRREVDD